ncbi:MAG: TonB-dependent receptor [Deltaproteobacteria bacterium]|jgi:outer membrane receptor protein involved in Fe transport|nr:TonB-dependent receptor [Deltaproteobacteria bacterium]
MTSGDPTASRALPIHSGEDCSTLDLQVNCRFSEKMKVRLYVTNALNDRPRQYNPSALGDYGYWPANPAAVFLTFEPLG